MAAEQIVNVNATVMGLQEVRDRNEGIYDLTTLRPYDLTTLRPYDLISCGLLDGYSRHYVTRAWVTRTGILYSNILVF